LDELITRALDLAKVKGAEYADIRVVQTEQERYVVRNGAVDTLSTDQSMGFGVRVVVGGAWGFASSNNISAPEIDRVTALAVQVARASALLPPNPPLVRGGEGGSIVTRGQGGFG
jgi:TldD protein